jgi:non-heme chloroperoxidase
LTPGWPDDPETVEEGKAHPVVFARRTIGQIADRYAQVSASCRSSRRSSGIPSVGCPPDHRRARACLGGSVAISPAPFRGVLPVPLAALRSSSPVLRNPANRNRAVPLTYEQFRYAFGNAIDEDEARQLHETYSVPGSGAVIFQAATANLNPWTEAWVDSRNPDRGRLLIVSADNDHTVPWSIANAGLKKQRRNDGVTEIVKVPDRGHSITIDGRWREVADEALAFVKRFV